MSRVKLKVILTYFVTSQCHVTRWYRPPSESRKSLVSEVNNNHDHFLTLPKWLFCLNLTSCEIRSLFLKGHHACNEPILTRRPWSVQK